MTFETIVREFIRQNPTMFAVYLATVLTIPIKDVLLPRYMGKLYQAIKSKPKQGAVSPMHILIIIVAILIIIQAAYIITDLVDNRLYPALQSYVRQLILQKELDNPNTGNGDVETGMTLTYMMRLPPLIFSVLAVFKNELVPGLLTLVIITAYICYLVPLCGLILLAILVAAGIVIYFNTPVCIKKYTQREQVFTDIFGQVDDTLSNALTIRASGTQQEEIQRLDANQAEYAALSIKGQLCIQRIKYAAFPLVLAFITFTCYYCYKQKMPQDKFVTIIIVCFILLGTSTQLMSSTYKKVVTKWGSMQTTLGALERASRPPASSPNQHTTSPGQGRPGYIDLVNISYGYDESNHVLKHATLGFKMHTTTLVKGQIGSGKSTLLQLLLKIKTPQTGEIYIDTRPYTKEYVYQHFFLISQNPKLLNRSIYENIIHSVPSPVPEPAAIEALVASLNLSSHIPPIDTIAGVAGSKLSGGQRQIVTILRMIVTSPDIVLLDEPTASLDAVSKELVIRLLQTSTAHKTVIWVAHDIESLPGAEVVYL